MKYTINNVTTEAELDAVRAFAKRMFPDFPHIDADAYAREQWVARMKDHGDLMLYARAEGEVIAMVFAMIGADGNVTIGPVAADPRCRNLGITRALLQELEKRAQAKGIHLLALGAVQSAEGFYLKCGYTPLLFVQTKPPHTLEALRALNPGYPEAWSYDDGQDIRLMLATGCIDRELQHKYDAAFPDCSTQTVFTKNI